jgi:hypothetical protein
MTEYASELGVAAIVVILLLREILPHFTKKNGTGNGQISEASRYIEYKTLASIEDAMRKTNHALANHTQVTTLLVERMSELRSEIKEISNEIRRKDR